jgi:hypothetical protein
MGYLMIGAGLIIGLIGIAMAVAVIATSATTNPN